MKNTSLMRNFIFITFIFLTNSFINFSIAQVTYTWNGSVSNVWANNNNWTPNTGVPGATDNVIIVTSANTPLYDGVSGGCNNFTLTSGTIDLGTFNFNVTGTTAVFTAGNVNNGTFTVTGATTTTFGNGPITMNAIVNISSAALTIRNTTFNNTTNLTKTGASNDASYGQNTFNGTTTIVNNGAGYWLSTNSVADTYNGNVTFTSNGGRLIPVQNGTGTQFNGSITLNCTSATGTIEIGNASGTSTFSAATTVNVGGIGFSTGSLQIRRITQVAGGATQTIALNGTASLEVGPSCTFTGNLNLTAPELYIRGGTFNNPVVFTKTGVLGNHNNGALNIFNSTVTINQTGNGGYFMLGFNSADVFNDNVIVNNTGTGGIALGWNGGTGTPSIAASKTISVGGTGFASGYLRLGGLIYNSGTPLNLTLTGTAALYIERATVNCVFNEVTSFIAPDIYVRGATFNNPVTFTKTGGSGDHNNGVVNTFNSDVYINQQSNTGYFMLSYNSSDVFNGDIIVTSVASGGISLGWSGGTGVPILSAGSSISIGGAGYSAGYLQLSSIIYNAGAPMNLTLTGTAEMYFLNTPSNCVFHDQVSITAPDIYVRGATFNAPTSFTKTGGSSNHNNGNVNFFNSTLAINQQSNTGYFMLSYNSADLFNDDLTLTSTGTGGIYFGYTAGTSAPVLASGKTILVGGAGFSGGFLYLGNFTQLGSTPINMTMTGTSYIQFARNTNIGGTLTITAPGILFDNSIFNQAVTANFTGIVNRTCVGGNTFTGIATITNSGVGEWNFANQAADNFMTHLIAANTGSGDLRFAYNSAGNIFGGNVTLNNSANGTDNVVGICESNNSTASIAGNLSSISNGAGGGNQVRLGIGINTSITIGGNLSITNSATGTGNNDVFLAYNDGSTLVVNGTTQFVNSGSGTSCRFMASEGHANTTVTFNNAFTFTNSSTASTDAFFRILRGTANFNHNIVLSNTSTAAGSNGFYIGWSSAYTGQATLANTRTITTSGAFSTGNISLIRFTQVGGTPQTLTTTGTSTITLGTSGGSSSFGGNLNFTSPNIYLNGNLFSGTTTFSKTGAINNTCTGGNTFTGISTLTNSGAGNWFLGSGASDNFMANVSATNSGGGDLLLAHNSAGNLFGGDVNFVNTANGADNQIGFCESNNSTASIAGNLSINNTGSGTANQIRICIGTSSSLNLTGNLSITNASSGTNGNDVYLAFGANSSVTINGTATILNNCSGANSRIYMADNATTATVTFQNDVTLSNLSTSTTDAFIRVYQGTINFNGNIVVNNTSTASGNNGIYLSWNNASQASILAATKTITIGASGFNRGRLNLIRFNQIGNTAQSLTLTGTAALYIGAAGGTSSFGGDVTFVAPTLLINGANFARSSSFTKNGSTNDACIGGNTFTGNSIKLNSGSGIWYMGNGSPDIYSADLTATNSGTGDIYLAHASTGNTIAGDLIFSNSATGSDNIIAIAESGGSNFAIAGDLTASNTGMAGGSTNQIRLGVGSNTTITVGGNLSISNNSGGASSYVYLAHGLNCNITVTGTTNIVNNATGSNALVYINEADNSATSIFQDDFTYSCGSTATNSYLRILRGTTSFNGNVILNNTATSSGSNGFYVGWAGYNGNAILASGKTIAVGGTGFTRGILQLYRFNQLGTTSQNLALTGSARLAIGTVVEPSTFNADLTYTVAANSATLTGSTFNGLNGTANSNIITSNIFNSVTTFLKNGTANDDANGGNVFNGNATFTTNNTGRWRLGTTADDFNGSATFIQTGSGLLRPAYNATSTFAGDISTVGTTTAIIFADGASGRVSIDGNIAQNFNGAAAQKPIVRRMTMNTSDGSALTLNVPVDISNDLAFNTGNINTDVTNILTLTDETATTTVGNANSFVNGFMQYQMTTNSAARTTLNLPVGDASDWRPAVIQVSHSANTSYTYRAKVYNADANLLGWTLPATVTHVSYKHYWDIDPLFDKYKYLVSNPATDLRTAAGDRPIVTLYYGTNDYVSDPSNLTICKNTSAASTTWFDIGGAGATAPTGSVSSTSSPTVFNSFSRFTLANKLAGSNDLPIELLSFNAVPDDKEVRVNWSTASETDNDYFTVEKSKDGIEWRTVAIVDGAGNSNTQLDYETMDYDPYSGLSYYRLMQTDF
jgi:hypothetical protein